MSSCTVIETTGTDWMVVLGYDWDLGERDAFGSIEIKRQLIIQLGGA